MIYGYARVSTDGQSVETQVTALTDAGAEKVFCEVASGAKTDRAQLRRVLDALGPGDVDDGHAYRPSCPLNLGPVRDRQAHRGHGRAIPILVRTVDRHCDQHRAADDCRSERADERGARPDPYPHCGHLTPIFAD